MTKYALIHGTRICDIVSTQAQTFPVSPEMAWVAVADDTTQRDQFVNGAVVKEPAKPITSEDVIRERERRLSLGFDFNFGDARGVHRIGTSAADLVGWDEVSKVTGAMIALGNGSATVSIRTDTGAATVTAMEWQSILIAAAQFRQPIWHGSFALQAMATVPADYATNESYWK